MDNGNLNVFINIDNYTNSRACKLPLAACGNDDTIPVCICTRVSVRISA
jgi:hypothetical protein